MLKPSSHSHNICYQKPDTPTWRAVTRVQQRQQEILAESWKYILLPERELIEEGEFICPITNHNKQLGRRNGNTHNTVARELVMRIKKWNSDLFAENESIRKLERLLRIYAWSEDLRRILKALHKKHSTVIADIQAWNMSEQIEENAKEFYLEFKRLTRLWWEAEAVIHAFSWAWLEKYKGFEYCCHSWMVIVCIINMIKLGIK